MRHLVQCRHRAATSIVITRLRGHREEALGAQEETGWRNRSFAVENKRIGQIRTVIISAETIVARTTLRAEAAYHRDRLQQRRFVAPVLSGQQHDG